MNATLWVLQILLALHTAMGGVWKFSHSVEQTAPSLQAIPGGAWTTLGVVELLVAVALVVPILTPLAAAAVAVEMLAFVGLHLASGASDHGPMIYWLVVAALCGFLVWGRVARL